MVIRNGVALLACCLAVLLALTQVVTAAGSDTAIVSDRTVADVGEEFKARFPIASPDGARFPNREGSREKLQARQGDERPGSSHANGVGYVVNERELYSQHGRAGRLEPPPLKSGAVRSEEAFILAQASPKARGRAASPKDFFVEVKATPTDPYVQQQVLFTLTVFMKHSLRGSVSPPQSDSKAVVESLGEARKYRKQRGGKTYEVYERKYLIYPQASGRMQIQPVSLTGSYVRGGRSYSVQRKSRSLPLNVRQIPPSFPGKLWLPAEQLILEEKWPSDLSSWQAGDPVTRSLKLRAKGLFVRQLPELDPVDVDGFRIYTEPANFKNLPMATAITGVVEQSVVLIPAQPGTYTVPGFKLPWWNTRTDTLEFAELPDKTVTVGEAAFGSLVVDKPEASTSSVLELEADSSETAAARGNAWFWVSMVFLSGWLVTGIILLGRSRFYQGLRIMQERRSSIRKIRKALRQACQKNDATQAKDGLLRWSALVWPDRPPASVSEIGRRCGGEFEQHVRGLNRALYGTSGSGWQGEALWESFDRQDSVSVEPGKDHAPGLQPLHKL